MSGAVTVVVATRDRAGTLADTLTRLTDEHDSPIIVVDNASRDDTAAVAARFADRGGGVRLIRLDHNAGAAARTVGVRAATTEYVAFADDDSWFAPGSLDHAAAVLGAHPDVGLIVARTVIEPGGHDDPIESALRRSPLGRRPGLPGPEVLGFLACAVVMRTRAYLAVGGFSPLLWFGSEETLLAYDLDAAGWALCHVPAVVAHHRPSPDRPAPQWRRRLHIRNDLLISWLSRPLSVAARHTAAAAWAALGDADRRAGLRAALVRAPQARRGRRRLPRRTEERIVRLARTGRRPAGTRVRPAAPSPGPVDPRATVVTITHNRRAELRATLTAMREGRDAMAMIVVDNGSTDGTTQMVCEEFPEVTVIRSPVNLGALGRDLAIADIDTDYVAFCDDDTRWRPGSLRRAADLLDAHPLLGSVTGRCLVGPAMTEDPLTPELRYSPVPGPAWLPGPALLGVMAGLSMLRVDAFRAVGGFHPRMWLGGEEELLAIDLADQGWQMVWAEDVVIEHHPSTVREATARRILGIRNTLWTLWLRRPARSALRRTRAVLASAPRDAATVRAVGAALAGAVWVRRERRVVSDRVEDGLTLLEDTQRTSRARRYVG